jgi:FMN phosphatase YigB (HAD superfamily)
VVAVLVKGLLFKLDDVLSSEARLTVGLYHRVAQRLARRPGGPAVRSVLLSLLVSQQEGDRGARAWNRLYHAVPEVPRIIGYSDLLQLVKKTVPVGTLFQGFRELAQALDQVGVRTAVMAGPYCRLQENKVEALRLEELFGTVVYTDFFCRNPRQAVYGAIRKLLEMWKGLKPAEVAYIADDPASDIAAARMAGLHTLRLRLHPTRHEADEPRSALERAEREFTTVHELIEALCRYYRIEIDTVLPGEWDYYLKPCPWRLMPRKRHINETRRILPVKRK